MRKQLKSIAVAGTVVFCPWATSAGQEVAELDDFLGDFARSCELTQAFEDYLDTLAQALYDDVGVKSVPSFPLGQRPFYKVHVFPDSFGVTMEVDATYIGLQVREIGLGLGRHAGGATYVLTFEATEDQFRATVEQELGPPEDSHYPLREIETDDDGNTLLVCNLGV